MPKHRANTVHGQKDWTAGDNSALSGAMSAGGAEAAAPLISHYLYGEKDGGKLTAQQKETVAAITGLLGVASGAVVGSNATDAVQGGLNAHSAVENNNAAVILRNEKVRKVAASAAWQGVRTLGVPTIVGMLCLSDSNCSDTGHAFMEVLGEEAEKTRHILGMGNSNGIMVLMREQMVA